MGKFDNLARSEEDRGRTSSQREAEFQRRMLSQQVLRNYSPLLMAHLRLGRSTRETLVSKDFKADVDASRRIAARIYAAITQTDIASVKMQEVRYIRAEVVNLVAQHRESGIPLDEDVLVDTLVEASNIADVGFDRDTINWRDVSHRASSALTASHAAMGVWLATSVYDFRMGRKEAMRRCMEAILSLADEVVTRVIGPTANREDKRSLAQSAVRDMAHLLCARYETIARRTVEDVLKISAEEHAAYFEGDQPFETMLEIFREEAREYIESVVQATEVMIGTSRNDEPAFSGS